MSHAFRPRVQRASRTVAFRMLSLGVQFGVVNIVRDNPRGRRVLPLLNWGRIRP